MLLVSFPLRKVVFLFRPKVLWQLAIRATDRPDVVLDASELLSCKIGLYFFDEKLFSLGSRLLPSMLRFLQNEVCEGV